MSKITWKAMIYFESSDETVKLEKLPVTSFQVQGGLWRTIHLNSAKESDVAFELDDARDHKNLHVFIPPTEGIAAAQLGDAFISKKQLEALFVVEATNGKTRVKGFILKSNKAVITRHPVGVQRKEAHALKIEMSLPDPSLQEIVVNGKWMSFKPV